MKPQYITSRIAIAKLNTQLDLEQLQQTVTLRHKDNVKLTEHKESGFKWRGFPFSITEMFKIMVQIDTFLRINGANAAIICVSSVPMQSFVFCLLKIYFSICLASVSPQVNMVKLTQLMNSLSVSHPYLRGEAQTIYRNVNIKQPPIKYLQSFSITPEIFIPVFDIFTEGRYNDFELVYHHQVEQELIEYYVNLNKPLQTGIGKKYCDQRPQTKFFRQPIQVCGDVKIVVFSFAALKKKHEFSLGFNTLNIDKLNSDNVLRLTFADLYEAEEELPKNIVIEMNFSSYCQGKKCINASNCPECHEQTKKLSNRYAQTQQDLQKLHRKRTKEQIYYMFSL